MAGRGSRPPTGECRTPSDSYVGLERGTLRGSRGRTERLEILRGPGCLPRRRLGAESGIDPEEGSGEKGLPPGLAGQVKGTLTD